MKQDHLKALGGVQYFTFLFADCFCVCYSVFKPNRSTTRNHMFYSIRPLGVSGVVKNTHMGCGNDLPIRPALLKTCKFSVFAF
jgi:hypothetical protein